MGFALRGCVDRALLPKPANPRRTAQSDVLAEEVDAFAAYSADTDRCYLLPFGLIAGRRNIQLRLAPSRNNQQVGIHWAEEYEFGATLALPGP
jgi:hypothetical protein